MANVGRGEVELSLTVPITNSLAFLFTVLGEWWAEGKVIGRGESLTYVPYFDVRREELTERQIRGLGCHVCWRGSHCVCRVSFLDERAL